MLPTGKARRTLSGLTRAGLTVALCAFGAALWGTDALSAQTQQPAAPLQRLDGLQEKHWHESHPAGGGSAGVASTGLAGIRPMTARGTVPFSGFQTNPYVSSSLTHPESAVAADFNQDGKLDAVLVSETSNTLQLMTGNGDGTFTPGPVSSLGTAVSNGCYGLSRAQAVDVNQDGSPDIVGLCTPYANYSNNLGKIVVLANQRNGTFAAPVFVTSGITWPYTGGEAGFQIYDVDGDGFPDIVAIGSGPDRTGSTTYLKLDTFFGSASGSFTQRPPVESVLMLPGVSAPLQWGSPFRIVASAGGPMLYFVENGTLYMAPLASSGSASLSTATVLSLSGYYDSTKLEVFLDLADLNGDGIPDILLSDQDGYLYVALGQSATQFGSFHAINSDGFTNTASVYSPADVNGDGCIDLLAAGVGYLEAFPGNCDGTFGSPLTTTFQGYGSTTTDGGYSYFSAAGPLVADFNGDGLLDVVSFDTLNGALVFSRGAGNGQFTGNKTLAIPPTAENAFSTHSVTVYSTPDLNGDGLSDLIAYTPNGLYAGINQPGGTFRWVPSTAAPRLFTIAPVKADFNHDGKEDYVQVSVDGSGDLHFWPSLSNGDGTFTLSELPTLSSTYEGAGVVTGDLNGDGWPDLVVTVGDQACIGGGSGNCGFVTYLNDGKGNLVAGQFIKTGSNLNSGLPYSISVADIDGDGRDDIVLSLTDNNYTSTNVVVYRSPAGSGYSKVLPQTVLSDQSFTPFTYALALGDLRNTGNMDLVVSAGNGVYKVLNDGYGNFAAPVQIDTQSYPGLLLQDFNRDGVLDVGGLEGSAANRLGLNVLLGYGDSTFAAPLSYYTFDSSSVAFPVNLNGDNNLSLLLDYPGSSWGTALLQNDASTRLVLSAAATQLAENTPLPLTAQLISVVRGQAAPSGYATFYEDGNYLGNGTLNASGAVSYTAGGLAAGTHTFSAIYSGDTTYGNNLYSNTVSVVVTVAAPAFALSSSSATLSVPQNGSATAVLNFSANAAFNDTLMLACSGLPAKTACSFAPAAVGLVPSGQATSTLTLTSAGSSQAQVHQNNSLTAYGLIGLPLMGLLSFRIRRKPWPGQIAALLCLLGFGLTLLSVTGCGSGSRGSGISPGVYLVTITATPKSSNAPVQSVSIALTVSQ